MDIRELLSSNRVSFNLKASTKEEVIDELIEILDKDGMLYDKEEFKQTVLKREKEFSTGIGQGIAIPHGKDTNVKQPSLVFGVSKNGIDYESIDGKLAHLFFLIAVPEKSDDIHLKVLSQISRKLMHEEVRKALIKAKSHDEVINAFSI